MLVGLLFGSALGVLSAIVTLIAGGTWGGALLAYFGISAAFGTVAALQTWRSGSIDNGEIEREVEFFER